MEGLTLTDIGGKYLAPRLLFCSAFIAFLCCCLLGSSCRRQNLYADFKRFHVYLSPLSYYYPTSAQLLNLAEQKGREKILVIVGGDSVFNCASLEASKLWTGLLERELGARYSVLNFSFQGGEPFEGGYWAAEALYKKGRKVIYLTDSQPGLCGEPIGTLLLPLFFDFYCRDLLLQDSQREAYKQRCLSDQSNHFDQSFSELERAGYLDRLTNARDLWQSIGYKNFFTVDLKSHLPGKFFAAALREMIGIDIITKVIVTAHYDSFDTGPEPSTGGLVIGGVVSGKFARL